MAMTGGIGYNKDGMPYTWTGETSTPLGSVANSIIGSGLTADSVELKVRPEDLISQAENVNSKVQAAKNAFTEMSDTIKRTASYWIGDAGDKHRALFDKMSPKMEDIFAEFMQHSTNLREIAAKYTDAETANVSVAEPLKSDVIA
jgi:WXG100 family type VII secretion target